jgi:hypothetical protein
LGGNVVVELPGEADLVLGAGELLLKLRDISAKKRPSA